MTTHLRARVVQAGALLALVGGILVVAPTAALADKPSVTIDNVSTDLPSGGTTNLQYTITNNNEPIGSSQVQVQISGISCTKGDCGAVITIAPKASAQRNATLTAPQVSAGQTKVVNLQITATVDGDTFTASQQLNVHGADKPKTVHQIVGVVKDGKGNAIAGANVGIRDSAGSSISTTSNGSGGYVFTTSDSQPIAVGSIIVGAAKEGYKTVTVTVQGGADKTVNVPLTLQALVSSPSASPSASASASATPSDEVSDGATDATDQPSGPATDAANAASNNSGSSSTLFIILGGLLVAAGIGAIVLVLMRRKSSADPDDPDDANGPSGPNGVVPPSQGRFNGVDPTRVGAPVGGRANDATMVANMGGQPSIADAPTMLQRAVPVEDEFPDPYGAPAVTPGNYAGPGGWGTASAAAAAAGTYGAAQPGGTYGGGYSPGNQYGAAAPAPAQAAGYDDGGYGAHPYARPQNEEAYGAYGAGQYGGGAEQQRFDEPTGMYRPEPPGDYHQDQGGYDQGGYGQPGGYDQAGQPGGYDQGGQPGGYDQGGQPGYGQGGYDQGGYHQEPEYPAAGGRGAYQPGGYSGGGYVGGQEPADDQGGYGSRGNPPGGGIDSGTAYGPPVSGNGGYGQGGGYGVPAGGSPAGGGPPAGGAPGYGADQGGYDPRAGYGRPDGGYEQGGGRRQQGGGGYGQDPSQGGYYAGEQQDGGGGRHGAQSRQQQPPPESTQPGQRRPLDWLDD